MLMPPLELMPAMPPLRRHAAAISPRRRFSPRHFAASRAGHAALPLSFDAAYDAAFTMMLLCHERCRSETSQALLRCSYGCRLRCLPLFITRYAMP